MRIPTTTSRSSASSAAISTGFIALSCQIRRCARETGKSAPNRPLRCLRPAPLAQPNPLRQPTRRLRLPPFGAVPISDPFSPFSPLTLAPHGTIFAESLDGTYSEPAAACAHHEDPGDLPFHWHAHDTHPARPDHAARGA